MEMTEFRMVQGWLLPAGANVEPTPVLVPQHYTKIAEVIGARLVDAVYNDVASIDGYRLTQVSSINSTSSMSRRCIRSLSRKTFSFILTRASSVSV